MTSWEQLGIELPSSAATDAGGNIYTTCPQCSRWRKKKHIRCLSVNPGKGAWNCHHCGWGGTLEEGEAFGSDPYFGLQDDYVVPDWHHNLLTDKARAWLVEKRKISPEIIDQEQIGSGEVYFPQIEAYANAIRFPFIKNGKVVNVKSLGYVPGERVMRLEARAERTFYGIDGCKDYPTWIIVEGEIDRLSVLTAGFPNVVSVPDGAPAPDAKQYQSKFDFLEREQKRLDKVKRFILAVDNDRPGEVLKDELARRLGPERCMTVTFPEGCKDANDVLKQHGPEALAKCINTAKEYPISGVFDVDDFEERIDKLYQFGMSLGYKTGWPELDKYFRVIPGYWTPVTGAPGSGKSEWLDGLLINMAIMYGWRTAVFSPENQPLEMHFSKLAEKFVGKSFYSREGAPRITQEELALAKRWVNEYFTFILPSDEESVTLQAILDKARTLVFRKGVKLLVIDPWNQLEHRRQAHLGEHEYIGQKLIPIRQFARRYGVHVFVVAHPTKLPRKEGTGGELEFVEPDLYHISGSADWYNMADGGIAIWRKPRQDKVKVLVRKVRFKQMGRIGFVWMDYDYDTGIFTDETGEYIPPIDRLTEEERTMLLMHKSPPKVDRENQFAEEIKKVFDGESNPV